MEIYPTAENGASYLANFDEISSHRRTSFHHGRDRISASNILYRVPENRLSRLNPDNKIIRTDVIKKFVASPLAPSFMALSLLGSSPDLIYH